MEQFYVGEDIKIIITYVDEDGNPIDADSPPNIKITKNSTEVLASTPMTWESAGVYYYWWNTTAEEKDVYKVAIQGEFSSKTDIEKVLMELL